MIRTPSSPSRRSLLAGLGGGLAASWLGPATGTAATPPGASLAELGRAVGITVGTALSPIANADPAYVPLLVQEAGLFVPEYGMTFHFLRPTPGAPDYSGGDEMLAFARRHGRPMHAQTLIWDYEQPDWLKRLSRREVVAMFDRHIDETLAHYAPAHAAGAVPSWTVVNEPFWPGHRLPGGFRNGAWHAAIGPSYVERAFKRAMAAAPGVRLMLNEAQCERFDALGATFRPLLLGLLDRLLAAGVRVDMVGLQGHLDLAAPHDGEGLRKFLAELARRKVTIRFTELDVNDVTAARDSVERDVQVAERFRDFLTDALAEPAVDALIFWQLADKHSWYRGEWYLKGAPPEHRRWPARPLLYDVHLTRKLAWHAVADALRARRVRG
jgi:endo-1,4-beta-xylanase